MSVHNDPKKWMIFMRCSDGIHFLWNGEGCLRVSPLGGAIPSNETYDSRWHNIYGELPESECNLLNDTMNSRARGFTILQHGRYQIIARGEFKAL